MGVFGHMKKGQKIKRYGNIYSSSSSNSPVIFIAMLAGIVIFSLIGWTLYPPVYEFVANLDKPAINNNQPPQPSSEAAPSVEPKPSQGDATPVPSGQPAPQQQLSTGIYVPVTLINNTAAFDALLKTASEAGVTYILIDAKDVRGTVHFTTDNEVAIRAAAVSPTAFDAVAVAKKITAAGMQPIARLHAFRDDLAARANRDMAVGYYDTNYVWLDNSAELGGRAWLNPYSDLAVQYIRDLVVELAQAGFSQVLMDSVTFPVGVGLEKAGYGKDAVLPKNEVIGQFVSQFEASLYKHGLKVTVCLSEQTLQSSDYIATPFSVIGMIPAEGVENADSMSKMVVDLKSMANPQGGQVSVMLPTNRSDGSAMTAAQLKTLGEWAELQGVSTLIYYNPEGSYSLQ